MQHILWRIQEFQNREARSQRGRIFGSGVCFDAPLHIPYGFLSENSEYTTYGKHCLSTTIKVYECYKTNPPSFKQGGVRPARWSWIRL